MLSQLSTLNVNDFWDENDLVSSDPGQAWSGFYHTITSWLEEFYPTRSITITSKDPDFITPEIRYLLRRSNVESRRNRTEQAAALTSRISCLIAKQNDRLLRRINRAAGTKQNYMYGMR